MRKKYREQDDSLIGYRYGDNNCLEVIGLWHTIHKEKRPRDYKVKCHKCSVVDKELHGEAEYKSNKQQIMTGVKPCGCSTSPRWTSEQTKIIITRICNKRGYVVEFPDTKVVAQTRIKLKCSCGHSWESNSNKLQAGVGCRRCGNKSAANSKRLSDEDVRQSIMESGKFSEQYKFRRIHLTSERNIEVICPVCSEDEFVQAGICSGVFVSSYSNLTAGKIPCRCSKNYKYTKKQREFTITQRITKQNLPYKFVEWEEEFTGAFTKFKIECELHGCWSSFPDAFVNGGKGCPSCSNAGYNRQKIGYLYILKVEGTVSDFTGYGISNNPIKRLNTHNKALNSLGYTISDQNIFKMSGELAPKVEREIKYNFPINSQEINGFKVEATNVNLYKAVISFVKSFEVEDVTKDFER